MHKPSVRATLTDVQAKQLSAATAQKASAALFSPTSLVDPGDVPWGG